MARSARVLRIPSDIRSLAVRKFDLNATSVLNDLRGPPRDRLEALKGDMKGKHGIRISDQWRVVFRWEGRDAHDVEIAD